MLPALWLTQVVEVRRFNRSWVLPSARTATPEMAGRTASTAPVNTVSSSPSCPRSSVTASPTRIPARSCRRKRNASAGTSMSLSTTSAPGPATGLSVLEIRLPMVSVNVGRSVGIRLPHPLLVVHLQPRHLPVGIGFFELVPGPQLRVLPPVLARVEILEIIDIPEHPEPRSVHLVSLVRLQGEYPLGVRVDIDDEEVVASGPLRLPTLHQRPRRRQLVRVYLDPKARRDGLGHGREVVVGRGDHHPVVLGEAPGEGVSARVFPCLDRQPFDHGRAVVLPRWRLLNADVGKLVRIPPVVAVIREVLEVVDPVYQEGFFDAVGGRLELHLDVLPGRREPLALSVEVVLDHESQAVKALLAHLDAELPLRVGGRRPLLLHAVIEEGVVAVLRPGANPPFA